MQGKYKNLSVGVALVLPLALSGGARAAEQYFQPIVSASVEDHSNLDLSTGSDHKNLMGYVADVAAVWGIKTPRSLTEVRPRILLQDYQERSDLNRTEEYLDFRNQYRSQLSVFDLFGRYSRVDSYRSDLLPAQFDDFNPGAVTSTGQSRQIVVGDTRTLYQLRPRYTYQLTQATGLGFYADVSHVDFSHNVFNNEVGYDNDIVNVYLAHQLNQKDTLSTGVYVSRYKTDDNENKTDGSGLSEEWTHKWSPLFSSVLTVQLERSKVHQLDFTNPTPSVPSYIDKKSTNWAANYSGAYLGQLNKVRFTIGRDFTPSSSGERTTMDQARLQYSRILKPRLQLTGAIRILRERTTDNDIQDDSSNRDYGTGEVYLRYDLTPTWFIQGGYQYFRQKYLIEGQPAHDNVALFAIGYQGLPPQK